MRVTHQLMGQSLNHHLSTSLRRLYDENRKIAAGTRIQYPSDDPVGLEATMRLGSMVRRLEQYNRNVDDALAWLGLTESALAQAGEGVHRARELAVQAANGSLTASDRGDIAKEISQIIDDLLHIGNTRYGDRYIFGGIKTAAPPFDQQGGGYTYVGSPAGQHIEYEIGPGLTLRVGVNGDEVFVPVIDALSNLETALLNDDSAAIDQALGELDDAFSTMLRWRSEVGARMNRLELTQSRYEQDILNAKALVSEKEDIDYAEAIMRLKQEESVYRAALAVSARIIQPTLIDFLR